MTPEEAKEKAREIVRLIGQDTNLRGIWDGPGYVDKIVALEAKLSALEAELATQKEINSGTTHCMDEVEHKRLESLVGEMRGALKQIKSIIEASSDEYKSTVTWQIANTILAKSQSLGGGHIDNCPARKGEPVCTCPKQRFG